MKLHKLNNYKLSATAVRRAGEIWLIGTFGPFGFEAITRECKDCHCFVPGSTEVWALKIPKGKRAFNNALTAIEYRLSRAQVPTLREKEEKQIEL